MQQYKSQDAWKNDQEDVQKDDLIQLMNNNHQ